MKRITILSAVIVGLLVVPTITSGQSLNKGVEGSPHDFSTNSWNIRKGVCSTCHQAHHTDDAQIVPLWSHKTSASTFTPYSSPTMNATVGSPSGASLACLSCHDGSL